MFQVIKPDSPDQTICRNNTTVFLAGSIDNGKAGMWAKTVEGALADFSDVTLFNPRREEWLPDLLARASEPVFKAQVDWELDRIDMTDLGASNPGCDIPFFYFEAGSVSPITLQELGFVIGTRRGLLIPKNEPFTHAPVVVCPDGFWRKGNVEIMCARSNITVYDDIESGIEALKIAVELDRSWRAERTNKRGW